MRVLVYPADVAGCGLYRLIFASEYLRTLGHDIHLQWPDQGGGFEIKFDDDGHIVDFSLPVEDVDVLVMQRVSHAWHVEALQVIRSRGIATVVDFDDNLAVIHPRNSAFWNYRTRSVTPYSAKNAEEICKNLTLVTVSTKSLLPVYAKYARGVVIDNYIPERYLYINGLRDSEPTFGWAGTLKSHPVDLQVVGRSVRELVDQGHPFRVVGPGEPEIATQLRLPGPVSATGVTNSFEWPTAIAQNLDVGMAPLEPGTFNTAKSRLKVLEYAAVGVPFVASPREEYRRFHKESQGAGFLAETPKQWATHIRQLLTDDILRKEMSEQARAYAATQTLEAHAWRWLEAWELAYKIQRGVSP